MILEKHSGIYEKVSESLEIGSENFVGGICGTHLKCIYFFFGTDFGGGVIVCPSVKGLLSDVFLGGIEMF